MSNFVDMHTHSDKSDGSDTPSELIEKAAKAGLTAIALTDHDTVSGIDEAIIAATKAGIELIAGVELSVDYEEAELHIVGLFIDHTDTGLKKILDVLSETRKTRNEQIADRLRALGITVLTSELPDSSNTTVTRAHFARLLVEKGYCTSISDAYNRYLAFGAPAHVPRGRLSPEQAISVIHRAGGLAVLAHLNQIKLAGDASLLTLVSDLKDMGLDGIECYYPEYSKEEQEEYLQYADIFDLAASGGSDYHGDNKDNEIGRGTSNERIHETVLHSLKKRLYNNI